MATFPSDSVRTKNWGTEVLTDADLEGQFDLIHNYIQAALDASTGHDHDGTSNQGQKISPANLLIASQAQGDILYASTASAWARLGAGTDGQFLKTQGAAANPVWATVNGDQTVDGSVVQVVNTQTGATAACNTALPYDDTIPQNTEGDEVMTLAITPKSATNKLLIRVNVFFASSGATQNAATLFQDTTAGALAAGQGYSAADGSQQISFEYYMTSGTTSETTFKVRLGATGGTVTFNGGSGARKYGGVLASSITITEIKAS